MRAKLDQEFSVAPEACDRDSFFLLHLSLFFSSPRYHSTQRRRWAGFLLLLFILSAATSTDTARVSSLPI
jgi:hypothetical protein